MKRFVAGMLCTALALSSAVALSSTAIQAILFPSKVTIYNGNEVSTIESTEGTEIINYKSKAYVPLRSFAEAMGAVVNYEEASEATNYLHKIDIYQAQPIQWALEKINYNIQQPIGYPITITPEIRAEDEASAEFIVKINNYLEEDIRVSPINLVLEVYAEDPTSEKGSFKQGPLVYSKSITAFEGLIPSKYGYEVSLKWDKTTLDGESIAPGWHFVYLHRPEEVTYTMEGTNDLKAQRIFSGMGSNLNYFWREFE